jgi:AraC family transcriptional regulator
VLWWPGPRVTTWQKLLPAHPSALVLKALRHKAEHGLAGSTDGRLLARGDGWTAQDVVCSSGPKDRAFEERHNWVSVAVVLSGTFTYQNDFGRSLLTPGALLLGDAGTCFTCGHQHGAGDRCLAFHFEPAFFERLAVDAGASRARFGRNSLPAVRALAPLVARALVAVGDATAPTFDELALDLAAGALRASGPCRNPTISTRDERRVATVIRHLEDRFHHPWALADLAALAGLSPFHFLRVFRATAGLTPHQYLLRGRLRAAAVTLATTDTPVTEVALASGFEDLSNFIRTFRAEFGVTPSSYRKPPNFMVTCRYHSRGSL